MKTSILTVSGVGSMIRRGAIAAALVLGALASGAQAANLIQNPGFENSPPPNLGNNIGWSIAPWSVGGGSSPNVVKVDGPGGYNYGNLGPESDASAPGAGTKQHYLDIANGSNDFWQTFTVPACPAAPAGTTASITFGGSFSGRGNAGGTATIKLVQGAGSGGTVIQTLTATVAAGNSQTDPWITVSGTANLVYGSTFTYLVSMPNPMNFDNAYLTIDSPCDHPPPPSDQCLKTDGKVTCNADGTYTITLTGGGSPGDTMSLSAQTAGVTVTPPQQPAGPTTTWIVSGATAGQTITFVATNTKAGGGSEPGTDQCCSAEITLTMPDCPKPTPIDLSIVKTGGTTPVQEPFYSFTLTISNNGAPFTGTNAITVTDVLPAGMTFNSVSVTPPGDWSCPTSVPAGGTLICTYTGTGPTGTGVIGTILINATAGGSAPYPPITNCASVATTAGTETTLDNNNSCVTVTKPGQVGEIIVKKEVTPYVGALAFPDLVYPISVTCGGTGMTFNLHDQQTGSMGNIPYGTGCVISENPPIPNICPPNQTPTWSTQFVPTSTPTINAPTTTVVVKNTFTCKPGNEPTGTLIINKTVQNDTPIDLSGVTYPATVTCGSTTTPVNLSTSAAQTVANIPGGTSCTVNEPVPAVPPGSCGTGRYPAWEAPTYSPASVTVPASGTATITVTNKLICERGGNVGLLKTVINNTQADVSGLTFPVALTCGSGSGSTRNVTLTPNQLQLVHNIPIGGTCTPSETLPAAPTNGCPAGQTPTWGAPSYSPASVTTVAGAGPTITITNTLNCEPTKVVQPVCKAGTHFIPGKGCIPNLTCRGGQVPNAAGTECVCTGDRIMRRGKCVEPVTCRAPAKRNQAGTGCICPDEMVLRGNTCVERRKPTIDIPRGIPGIGFPGGRGNGDGGHRGGGQDGGGRSGGKDGVR